MYYWDDGAHLHHERQVWQFLNRTYGSNSVCLVHQTLLHPYERKDFYTNVQQKLKIKLV